MHNEIKLIRKCDKNTKVYINVTMKFYNKLDKSSLGYVFYDS